MFLKFSSKQKSSFQKDDRYAGEKYKPMIKASICTGEKVAGFIDKDSGKFVDVMVIRSDEDLKLFCAKYGAKEEEIGKIW